MPGNEEILRYTEEQLQRIAEGKKPELHREWSVRRIREAETRRRKTNLEAEIKEKNLKKRIYGLIEEYFAVEDQLDEKILPWNHKLSGRGFTRTTLKKAVEDMNLQNDSNVFFPKPARFDMSNEELLAILSKNLPDKTCYVEVETKDGFYTLPIKFKRMKKE